MFNIFILLGLLVGISTETAHNGSLDINCTRWIPVNVTDVWDSCAVLHNPTRAWRCSEKSNESLVILLECKSSKCTAPREVQVTAEPTKYTKGQIKLSHEILLMFLYGAASGAGLLLLLILLLSTVGCYLKKQRKKKSLREVLELSTPIQTPDDEDHSVEEGGCIPSGPHVETQNESRHEVGVYESLERSPGILSDDSGETPIPPSYTADTESGSITENDDAAELEDTAPFAKSCKDQEKPTKAQHPLYVNCHNGGEGREYMHLISETREKDVSTNLSKKPPKSTKGGKTHTSHNIASSARPPAVKKKPTRSKTTNTRPSSAEYVNDPIKNIYINAP